MNAEGFVTAPGMFSPDHADPGSRRLADALAGRLSGRVADLGAGWGWLARAALERNPAIDASSTCTRPSSPRSRRRASTSPTRGPRFHWTDVTGLGAGGRPTTR